MIAANSDGGEIGGLVVVSMRGETVDTRAMCSGDHTLCGQGLSSLHDGHQIVGSIAVLSPIWRWCLCRYRMLIRPLEVAEWPLLHGHKGGRVANWADSSFLSLSILFVLAFGYERFHVVDVPRGDVGQRKKEERARLFRVRGPAMFHTALSETDGPHSPSPKQQQRQCFSQLRHVPCPSWHFHHNSPSPSPMTRHEMLPAHLLPVHRP